MGFWSIGVGREPRSITRPLPMFSQLCVVINDVPQSTAFSFWLEYAHMMYDVEYLTTSTGRAAVQPACESMTRLPCTCIPADVYTRSVSINIYRKTIELTSRFLSILHHILSISFFSFLFFFKQTNNNEIGQRWWWCNNTAEEEDLFRFPYFSLKLFTSKVSIL